MAQTLSEGPVIPNEDGQEAISPTGVAEIRTLGVSVNTALAAKADTTYVDAEVEAANYLGGRITSPADAFTLPPKIYTISSVQYAGMVTNLPEVHPGTLVVEGNVGQPVRAIRFLPYGKDYSWETVSKDFSNGFMPWRKGSTSGGGAYAANAINQARMIHHYGPVDTGGLGAVAWRIDHGLVNFRDIMLPIFKAAGIVPMITLNSRDWFRPENEGVTYSEVNGWVSRGEVEISNHGATHANVEGDAEIAAFVAEGLAELEDQLPSAAGKIFGFHVPGVGVTGAFGGFQGGTTPENWDTAMGRAILKHHAFGSGHIPGTDLRVLDGTIRQGLLHMATDARPGSEITAKIDEAIATGRGFQIMTHPSTIGAAGRQTAADIQAVVNHIVRRRDAGELAVLSPYQLMVADSTRPVSGVDDVTGLAARLTALERDTGTLTVTSTFPQVTNGNIWVRRLGKTVHVTLYDVEFSTSTPPEFFYLEGLLPVGYRPAANTSFAALADVNGTITRRVRFQANGQILLYGITAENRINVTASYLTPDAWPA